MQFVFNDGGRKAAGFAGEKAGDCVARAIAIATGRPYLLVYADLAEGNRTQRKTRAKGQTSGKKTAAHGINTKRQWFKDYMAGLGWTWTPTMRIGSGCQVHLADGELPMGRLIVAVSKHYTAVIDGVVHDTHDPQRAPHATYWYNANQEVTHKTTGGRCVYGYWSKA